MNIVALIGNVASDPALTYTTNGKAVCTFRIAVSRPGGEDADFFTIASFDRQAEVCNEYLSIGRRIAVEGRMHYADRDGSGDHRVEVVANRVELLGARQASTV